VATWAAYRLEELSGSDTTHAVTGKEFAYGIRKLSNRELVFRFVKADRNGAEETFANLSSVRAYERAGR
jgi:hypothetical protein